MTTETTQAPRTGLVLQVFWTPNARPAKGINGTSGEFDLVDVPCDSWAAFTEILARGAMIGGEMLLTAQGAERGTRRVTRRLPILFGADAILRVQPCIWTLLE